MGYVLFKDGTHGTYMIYSRYDGDSRETDTHYVYRFDKFPWKRVTVVPGESVAWVEM